MFLEERVPAYIDELKQKYFCDESDLDFATINKNKKLILRKSGGKKISKEMNEQIDLDYLKKSSLLVEVEDETNMEFVRESNLIEDVEDIETKAFLEDEDTKIEHIYPQKQVYHNLDTKESAKRAVAGCVIMATNPKMGVMKFATNHLEALKFVLREARLSRVAFKNKGVYAPLTHDMITTANEMVLPGDFDVASFYRNEYTYGSCFVTGAKWTPVANAKVPARMEALVQWFNQETEMNPITKAAILHCEFIAIHPFSDGNGRTARLLMNYELARHNLPTIVIKAKNKKAYINALEKGIMTGDVTDLAKMIEERVLESQNKQLCAIEELQETKKQIR